MLEEVNLQLMAEVTSLTAEVSSLCMQHDWTWCASLFCYNTFLTIAVCQLFNKPAENRI